MEDMFMLRHEDRPAAWIGGEQVAVADWVLARDISDPVRRWVFCRSFFVLELQGGRIPGVFSEARADHFARSALMPDKEFADVAGCDDAVIAEHFGVPVSQVPKKRVDAQIHAALHH